MTNDLGGLDIADDVMIGPNVSLITSGHPIEPSQRRASVIAKPIMIERNVWIQEDLVALITERGIEAGRHEFESLMGLGTGQIDELSRRGFATREYVVLGEEHFLYVLNRIAEEPIRVYQALVDLLHLR